MQTDDASSTARGDAPGEAAADDGRSFANLVEARDALWRVVNELDRALGDLGGELAAVHAIATGISECHGSMLGTAGDGLHRCASRALDGLGDLKRLHERLHEAAIVVRQNDPTRLSLEAARYQPVPHRETY